jgi:hypothetical protein
VIGDIVGLRIVCNNTSDITRVQEVLAQIGPNTDGSDPPWHTDPGSEKQYHVRRKDSGYRAYHLNMIVRVPDPEGWQDVTAEIQVRTLLQDAWGELTHEDTYKPGVSLPPLATRLARRMADLLAAVDDIAEDIRGELDRAISESIGDADESEQQVLESETVSASVASQDDQPTVLEPPFDEVSTEISRFIENLDRPASLASIAFHVQRVFGARITEGWLGFGSFKSLVQEAVPDAQIQPGAPGYVIPPSFSPSQLQADPDVDGSGPLADVPDVVARLSTKDKTLPTMSRADMAIVTDTLSHILASPSWTKVNGDSAGSPGLKEVNNVSKVLRDRLGQIPISCSRMNCDYLVKSLFFAGHFRPDLSVNAVRVVIAAWIERRAREAGLSPDPIGDRRAIREWLSAEPAE